MGWISVFIGAFIAGLLLTLLTRVPASATRGLIAASALLVLFGGCLAACQYRPSRGDAPRSVSVSDFARAREQDGSVQPLPDPRLAACVSRLIVPWRADDESPFELLAGSAVKLSPGHWLTCLHNLPADSGRLELDGTSVPYSVVRSGDSPRDMAEDWAWIHVPGCEGAPDDGLTISTKPIAVGDVVYLIGYYGLSHDGWSLEQARQFPLSAVRCEVKRSPAGSADADELVFLQVPKPFDPLNGLSGGAAVVQDRVDGGFSLLGIWRGTREVRFLGLPLDSAGVVRRIPSGVIGARENTRLAANAR